MTYSEAKAIKAGRSLIREAERIISQHQKAMERRRGRKRAAEPIRDLKPSTAEIREAVDKRDLCCVVCFLVVPDWHLHHVDSGSGKARRQSVENCAKTCGLCHKLIHLGDLPSLNALRIHFKDLGFGETVRVLDRRIAKIEEARR